MWKYWCVCYVLVARSQCFGSLWYKKSSFPMGIRKRSAKIPSRRISFLPKIPPGRRVFRSCDVELDRMRSVAILRQDGWLSIQLNLRVYVHGCPYVESGTWFLFYWSTRSHWFIVYLYVSLRTLDKFYCRSGRRMIKFWRICFLLPKTIIKNDFFLCLGWTCGYLWVKSGNSPHSQFWRHHHHWLVWNNKDLNKWSTKTCTYVTLCSGHKWGVLVYYLVIINCFLGVILLVKKSRAKSLRIALELSSLILDPRLQASPFKWGARIEVCIVYRV